MKQQTLFSLLLVALVTIFYSCNDTIDKLGFTIQPDNDRVHVGTDTLALTSRTVLIDSVYSRTKYPILGKYEDPIFGEINSDYIGELYYPENLEFKKDAKIDSVRLTVSYTSMIGDSLAPMQVAVYKVNKELPKGKNYTNFDPETHSDMSKELGKKTFRGKNNTYRTEKYYSGNTVREVKIYEINAPLPIEIGQDFLDEFNKPDHGALKDPDSFREFFPGLYVTTNFGSSTILNVNLTSLKVHYSYLDKKGSSQKTDTIRADEWRLNITPEVTQINHIENKSDMLLDDNENGTFIKSPAGVNTEITIPISKIAAQLDRSALNQARFVINTVPLSEDSQVKLTPPENLLLIHKDSVNQFFEKGSLHNNLTSFVATFDYNTQTYSFGNIAAMLNYYNKEFIKGNTKELDQVFNLVPVDITFTSSGSGGTVATSIYNQMKPSAAMINNKEDKLRLDIIYSSF